MSNLRQGKLDDITASLSLGTIDEWSFMPTSRLPTVYPRPRKVMVHYDFSRAAVPSIDRADFTKDPLLEWMSHAEHVVIVTCVASSKTLRKRLRRRFPRYLRARLKALVRGRSAQLRYPLAQARILGQPGRLTGLYENWFSHCSHAGFMDHWQLNTNDTPSIERIRDVGA